MVDSRDVELVKWFKITLSLIRIGHLGDEIQFLHQASLEMIQEFVEVKDFIVIFLTEVVSSLY